MHEKPAQFNYFQLELVTEIIIEKVQMVAAKIDPNGSIYLQLTFSASGKSDNINQNKT